MHSPFQSLIAEGQLQAMTELASTAPEGAFVEIGVFRGGSAWKLYELCLKQGRELHLFDTFSGTPYYTPSLDKHKIDKEFAPQEQTAEKLQYMMPTAKVHVGVYPNTHPEELVDVAFVHCDCDQYLSYCAVIERMWPIVVPGGFLLFDDYPYLMGAKRAVEEYFSLKDLKQCGQRFYVVKET